MPSECYRINRVTLITVFPYPDGFVISADSQETVKDQKGNEFKYSVLKLKPEKFGEFQVIIAGGGNGDAIDTLIEDCRQSFAHTTLANLHALKKALQSKIQDCRKELRALGDSNQMHLLIAAHIGTSYAIWKTTKYQLRDITEPDMIGFTDYMYRHTVKEFHPKNLPAIQLVLLSLRVLDLASQTSTCVGEPYSVVIVRDNGIHVFDDQLVRHYAKSITMFGASVNRLLLACGDTSIRSEVFDDHVKEFAINARHLRQANLQEVGEREFRRMAEPGYTGDGVSGTPLGSIITYSVTAAGDDSIEVREQTTEEKEWWNKIRQMAAEPNPNLTDGRDLRLMQCTNSPCSRQFFGKVVRPKEAKPILSGTCPACSKVYVVDWKDEL
jgi:hypothetical protein